MEHTPRPRRFQNDVPGREPPPFWRVVLWLLSRRIPETEASRLQPSRYPTFHCATDDLRIFFVGHCTLLIEVHGLLILTDPMFSDHASPFPRFGPRRIHPPGIRLDWLPPIDAVLITHNHYDHLDEATIRLLGDGPEYIVPEGLKPWFTRRGITRVRELAWWEGLYVGETRITATPALHWSKRTPFDRNRSHWNGYAIESGLLKLLFVGDSGYWEGFRTIGERLGPFHVAALPIGAYDPPAIMQNVHMTPEEAVQACGDVRATVMVPTHYGCFPLTDEELTEPPRRAYKAWIAGDRDPDHLWLLAPGEFRSLEDMIYIPTIRSLDIEAVAGEGERPMIEDPRRASTIEWSIAMCPHKGGLVDLQAWGERRHYFESDGGNSLSLNHVRCSGSGDLPECAGAACPLRDPAFLRSHDLHGLRDHDGRHEAFVEMDVPPQPRWWQEGLRIVRLEDKEN